MRPCLLLFALSVCVQADSPVREMVYSRVSTTGGQVVPLFDNGYLIYPHQPNRLQVVRPDGHIAYDMELPCPGTGTCSAAAVAVDSDGNVAVSFGYWTRAGRGSGIRILAPQGQEVRFIETSPYLATSMCFDRKGDLWSAGRQSDSSGEMEDQQDYSVVRKFSREGQNIGNYLPRSLWPNRKAQPGRFGRGYWHMYSASERIGAIFHENHADNPAEWIEWDLNGNIVSRTIISTSRSGRAYTSDGRLYCRFRTNDKRYSELRVLDTASGNWFTVSANLPAAAESDGAFLLGADGAHLVYRVGYGNVRLLWVRPGLQ